MIKIWGRINSTNVRKVLWCAEELQLEYQQLDAGGTFGVVDGDAYRQLNPNGRVPTLDDHGFVLWESNAIVRYLAARYGAESPFYPADLHVRANADKWMDWVTSSLASPFRDVFWGVLRTPVDQQNWAAIDAGCASCQTLLAMADATLAQQPYLSGAALGMGDIPLGSFIYAWFEMPIERIPLPHLEAWYERLKQRPAYQRAVMTALT